MLPRSVLLSISLWFTFAGVIRVGIVPPETCGDATISALRDAAGAAREWLIRNQLSDGRYTYLYYIDQDKTAEDYNEVRHAGVTMALYQAAGHDRDLEALAAADAGLAWMTRNLVKEGDWQALAPFGGRAKLGATALMVVALAERRLATGDQQHDALMRELGRFILVLQKDDGSLAVNWLLDARMPDPVGTSRYYPGEALLALALLHEAFPGEGWNDAAVRAAAFLTEVRDAREGIPFPPLPDQWLAYGLAEMADWGLDEAQLEHIRRLAGRFGLLIRTEAQREGSWLGPVVRGPAVRAAGVGTWVEGLAAIWRVSASDPRLADLEPRVRERLGCGAGILASRQTMPDRAAQLPRPDLAQGAWFNGGETRMDDQQHALSGLLYALDALTAKVQREPEEFLEPPPTP